MGEEIRNSNNLKQLLEKFSVEEISGILDQIDNKIIDLMKYTSTDFLELNRILKEGYSQLKTLYAEMSELTLVFSDSKYQQMQDWFTKEIIFINEQYQVIVNFRELEKKWFADARKNEQLLQVNLKNLRQNLKSLKLLLVNENTRLLASHEQNIDEGTIIAKLIAYIDFFISETNVVLKNPHYLSIFIEHTLKEFNETDTPNSIERLKAILNANHEKKNSRISALQEIENEINESVSEVVTNLQFQDIIRQKVEHIHQIHKEILEELIELKSDPEGAIKNSKLKYFLQIGDVSGLQAAQLLNTNKQYQKALKTVVQRMIGISVSIENLALGAETLFDDSLFGGGCSESITECVLKTIDSQTSELKKITEHIEDVHTDPNLVGFFQLFETLDTLKMELSVLQEFKGVSDIASLHDEIQHNIQEMMEYGESQNKIADQLEKSKYDAIKRIQSSDEQVLGNLAVTFDKLKTDSINKLARNKKQCLVLSEIFRSSADEVRYYEYFERVIEQIIDELNFINLRLVRDKKEITKDQKQENLEFIKKKYTMESEHKIHEFMMKKDKHIMDFLGSMDEIDPETDKKDNDIEFF